MSGGHARPLTRPADDWLVAGDEHERRRPGVATVLAVVTAGVLVAGLLTAVRLLQVDLVVTEGVGGAVRTEQRRVQGDVRLIVRNDGRLPLRLVGADLALPGVEAQARGGATVAPGEAGVVDVAFTIDACRAAALRGRLVLEVRAEHGPLRRVTVPVSVDGADGSTRLATLLGFCAPPFS